MNRNLSKKEIIHWLEEIQTIIKDHLGSFNCLEDIVDQLKEEWGVK